MKAIIMQKRPLFTQNINFKHFDIAFEKKWKKIQRNFLSITFNAVNIAMMFQLDISEHQPID